MPVTATIASLAGLLPYHNNIPPTDSLSPQQFTIILNLSVLMVSSLHIMIWTIFWLRKSCEPLKQLKAYQERTIPSYQFKYYPSWKSSISFEITFSLSALLSWKLPIHFLSPEIMSRFKMEIYQSWRKEKNSSRLMFAERRLFLIMNTGTSCQSGITIGLKRRLWYRRSDLLRFLARKSCFFKNPPQFLFWYRWYSGQLTVNRHMFNCSG